MMQVEIVGALFAVLILLRWGPSTALIWLIPYQGIIGGFNLALSDVLLPLVLLLCFVTWNASRHGHAGNGDRGRILYFGGYVMMVAVMMSIAAASILHGHSVELSAFALSSFKLVVGFIYAAVVGTTILGELRCGSTVALTVWSWAATFVSLVGLAGLILGEAGISLSLVKGGRVNSTFDDANLFASYLLVSLTLLGLLAVCRPSKARWLQVAVLIVALMASGSRAIVPAILIGLILALFVSGRGKLGLRALGILMATLPVMFIAQEIFGGTYQESPLIRTFEGSLDVREDARWPLWVVAFSMWRSYPLVGVGLGQYQARSWEFAVSGIDNVPHSTLLSFGAEMGAVGLIAFLLLPTYLVVQLAQLARSRRGLGEAYLLFGIFALGVQSLTINIENSRMLWAFFGVAWAWWQYRKREPTSSRGDPVGRSEGQGVLLSH